MVSLTSAVMPLAEQVVRQRPRMLLLDKGRPRFAGEGTDLNNEFSVLWGSREPVRKFSRLRLDAPVACSQPQTSTPSICAPIACVRTA